MNASSPTPPTHDATAAVDPQCPLLIERIEELKSDLAIEAEPARVRQVQVQIRVLTHRARCLGCFDAPSGERPDGCCA